MRKFFYKIIYEKYSFIDWNVLFKFSLDVSFYLDISAYLVWSGKISGGQNKNRGGGSPLAPTPVDASGKRLN